MTEETTREAGLPETISFGFSGDWQTRRLAECSYCAPLYCAELYCAQIRGVCLELGAGDTVGPGACLYATP